MAFSLHSGKNPLQAEQRLPDSAGDISFRYFLPRLAAAAAGGVIFAAALPPVNFAIGGGLTLTVLLLAIRDLGTLRAMLCGWVWGLAWSIPAFFWLREIHPAVPWLIAPVLSLWPMVWAGSVPWLKRALLTPPEVRFEGSDAVAEYLRRQVSGGRLLGFAAVLCAWWTVLEFSRSAMLPWNNLAAVMWKYPIFLSPAEFAGQFGLTFIIAMVNTVIFLYIRTGRRYFLLVIALLALVPPASGFLRLSHDRGPAVKVRIGAVQGDISQRRNADNAQAQEALDIYLKLTDRMLSQAEIKPDVTVWPETAVPYPFRGAGPVCRRYRMEVLNLLRKYKTPFLIGTIDFAVTPERRLRGITNSALLVTGEAPPVRYDKIHRVPFGEYIPFRSFLPQSFISLIDMNRDLVPGQDFSPVEIAPGVRAGVAICFESVFAYVAREEARRGANMLLVISNDAWYPASCEPEQHLANAVMRSVETGLNSVRCGNNGGTLVISPEGRISQVLPTPGKGVMELRRGRSAGIFELTVPAVPRMTFYTRYGEWFVVLCSAVSAAGALYGIFNLRRLGRLYASLTE